MLKCFHIHDILNRDYTCDIKNHTTLRKQTQITIIKSFIVE